MRDDGVWAVHSPVVHTSRQSNTDPLKSELLIHDARAGFPDDVKAAFLVDPAMVTEVAARVLEQHFPESPHSDILDEVGLSLDARSMQARKRSPQFRQRVLVAYEFRCAVCSFDLKIGTTPIALDAAHIRWHQAGGPDAECNGLALCVLHHKTFDLGAFTVVGFDDALLRHHGEKVRQAQRPEWFPYKAHLMWHREQVFKGSPRHLSA
jgi:putative restriction endonuclease